MQLWKTSSLITWKRGNHGTLKFPGKSLCKFPDSSYQRALKKVQQSNSILFLVIWQERAYSVMDACSRCDKLERPPQGRYSFLTVFVVLTHFFPLFQRALVWSSINMAWFVGYYQSLLYSRSRWNWVCAIFQHPEQVAYLASLGLMFHITYLLFFLERLSDLVQELVGVKRDFRHFRLFLPLVLCSRVQV